MKNLFCANSLGIITLIYKNAVQVLPITTYRYRGLYPISIHQIQKLFSLKNLEPLRDSVMKKLPISFSFSISCSRDIHPLKDAN